MLMNLNGLGALVSAENKGGAFEDSFDYATFDDMSDSGIWQIETVEKKDSIVPKVEDGVIKMTSHGSLSFGWTKVDGVGAYSSEKSYVFDFDITVTDSGNGSNWSNPAHTRILYVAFGGYYNQIELNNDGGKVRAGNTYQDYDASVYQNKMVHAKVVLEGTTVTSTLTDTDGNILVTGSRSEAAFSDMNARNRCMTYLVLRCEDGAVEIDNFRFSVRETDAISRMPYAIEEGKSVEYVATVVHDSADKTSLRIGNTDIFSLKDTTMSICGSVVLGDYGSGTYGIRVELNLSQTILRVEVTLPNGGTVRRGYGTVPTGSAFVWYSTASTAVSGEAVRYEDVLLNDYELMSREPSADDFAKNVYNLVNSFEDPHTTRLFAWTAKSSFLNDGDTMALRYRIKGETAWHQVDARKQKETTKVASEDYFKADLSGLAAETEYEYQIGIKDSDNESRWSPVYTFKTADKEIGSFQFVAIGDTQSVTWNGTNVENRGYMYTMAALDQAFRDAGKVDFVLNAGDVTDSGSNLSMWNWYFKAIGAFSTEIPHFATIGNHDSWVNDHNNYFGLHFNHPDNGSDALDWTYAEKVTDANLKVQFAKSEDTIYSYNYGDAHFIVLNSGAYCDQDEYILKAQRAWLIRDLEENKDAKWKIVLVHEPVYHRKGGAEDRPWLYDVIEGYGVDLVIQGHSHLVTRTYPMKDGAIVTKTNPDVIQKGSGTVYTTIGSTTLNHDSLGDPNVEECMLVLSPENHQASYTVVSVNGDKLTMTVKQLDGYELDRFTIVSEADEEDETDNNTVTENVETTGAPSKKQQNTGIAMAVGLIAAGCIAVATAVAVILRKKRTI